MAVIMKSLDASKSQQRIPCNLMASYTSLELSIMHQFILVHWGTFCQFNNTSLWVSLDYWIARVGTSRSGTVLLAIAIVLFIRTWDVYELVFPLIFPHWGFLEGSFPWIRWPHILNKFHFHLAHPSDYFYLVIEIDLCMILYTVYYYDVMMWQHVLAQLPNWTPNNWYRCLHVWHAVVHAHLG